MKKIFYFFILCASVSVAQKNTVGTSSISCIPVAAVCNPVTYDSATSAGMGIGMSFVGLHQIQNASAAQASTLQDFTCTDSTSLNIAQPYAFEVHTGLAYEETVTAWIDFNNDGAFDDQEIVFHDSGEVYMHSGFVTIPAGALNTFTPIRMRVGSDYSGSPSLNACDDLLYGHYEDYKIYYGVNIGVGDIEERLVTSVYPNPMHHSASIIFAGSNDFRTGEFQLSIYNSFGQLVSIEKINSGLEIIIDRGRLLNGLYFYKLTNALGDEATGKFLVD